MRPRISGANVTGLGTLISGAYIGLEIGTSKEHKRDFVALETPPVVTGELTRPSFVLKTPDLGSLDTGTPIFFRRLQVGQVASYALDTDGKSYCQGLRASALRPVRQSGHALLARERDRRVAFRKWSQGADAVGFVDPDRRYRVRDGRDRPVLPPAEANTVFTLYGNRAEAFSPPPEIRRPTSSSSTSRCADSRPARRSSFAAFRSARSRMFARKST